MLLRSVSLILFPALVLMLVPGSNANAAITTINAWSNIYSNTAYPGTVAFTAGAGSNRMLVVAVVSSTTTAAAQTASVTYGGQAMTQVRADGGTTQAHTYLFYLNEAGLQAASNTNLVFSFNLTAATNNVYAAVYGGVDQSGSPVSSSTGNTGTTSVALTSSLTIGTGELGVEVVNMSRTGAATYRTITTPAANWTQSAGPNQLNNGTVYTSGYALSDSTAGSTSANHTISSATSSLYSMSAMSLRPAITTLGNGTDPGNASLAPGGAATMADAFSFQTSTGTDTIADVTVTLATGTYAGLSKVEITNDAGTTIYGSVTNPASDAPVITLSTNTLTATTTLTEYRIRITPKTHANMPAPAGSSYAVTARISAWSGTKGQSGSDTAGTTVTIDNLSPANVTAATATAGGEQVALAWTNPVDADFHSVVVLRRAGSAVADVPVEGTTYVATDTIGTATVACVTASPGTSCTDAGLTNGTAYYYKIFAKDSNGNYSATGVVPTGSPATPIYCPGGIVTATADTGTGSLRECINYANANPGSTISFNIATAANQSSGGDSWWEITPASALPTITAAGTVIDGTTQTTNRGNTNSLGPEIEINGTGAGTPVTGLTITGGTSTVRGLVINRFTFHGIKLDVADSNTIVGNYIGTDATGTLDRGNAYYGVLVYWHSGSNIIGTSAAADRNVISGNDNAGIFTQWSDGNIIKNNYLGTNATGTAAVGNKYGIDIYSQEVAGGNIIGGSGANEGNLISGNLQEGIYLDTGPINVTIKGNKIGTQANGTTALANVQHGIFGSGTGQQIGGTAAGEGNVIAGNSRYGIYFQGDSSFIQGNYIGTDAGATLSLGNGWGGMRLDSTASNNTIGGTAAGAGNVIANNNSAGIAINVNTNAGNSILGNAIYSNSGLAIDLKDDGATANDAGDTDTGPNGLQNFPVLSSALTNGTNSVTVSGTLNSIASTNFRIEFFASTVADASGYGEAQRYLGFASATTDGSNNASFSQNLAKAVAVGEFITATATNLTTNNTSEMALNVTATAMTSISGTVYTDEGVTNIGAGKTVRLVVAGASAGTAVTAAGGTYSIDSSVALPANTPFLVYVDGDAKKGTTVSASTGANLSGINIYTGAANATGDGYVIVRHDNAGTMTSALMSTALGAYSDTDIQYTVPAGVLTVSSYNTLYVPATHTFAPGANTSLDGVKILGTFSGGSYTHTITGTWTATAGTFTAGTSTISMFVKTSNHYFYPGASSYYNVVFDSHEFFFYLGGSFTASGDVTLKTTGAGTGTLSMSSYNITANNFLWQSSYVIAGTGVVSVTGNWSKTGGGYFGGALNIAFTGSGNSTFTPGSGSHGSVTVNKSTQTATVSLATNNLVMAGSKALTITSGIFDISGLNLNIGAGSTFSNDGTLRLQGGETLTNFSNDTDSGTVAYNGGGAYASLLAGNTYYHLTFDGAGSWIHTALLTVNGNLTITTGTLNSAGQSVALAGNWSNAGTYTSGANTVTLNGTNQSITGNTTFNNLTKSVATARTLTFAANSTTTVNGTATLNGASGQLLSLVSSSPGTRWNFTLGAASTKAISYVSVTDSDASGSDAAKIPVLPTNSSDGGHNISWFGAPLLTFLKTVAVTSDPVNSAINPKNIPGAEVLYTMRVTNSGAATVDNNTLIITDPIPANTEVFTGNLSGGAPFVYTDGTPTSALSCTFTALNNFADCMDFSNDSGVSWTYVPNGSFDPAVTNIRFSLSGAMSATGGGNPYFDLNFRVRVK